jgi:hypothetical protein
MLLLDLLLTPAPIPTHTHAQTPTPTPASYYIISYYIISYHIRRGSRLLPMPDLADIITRSFMSQLAGRQTASTVKPEKTDSSVEVCTCTCMCMCTCT